MKNKSLKMISSILLMLMIILISSTANAKFMTDTDGDGIGDADWHYAAEEISYNTSRGQIVLTDSSGKKHYYYCINHEKRTLKKGIASAADLNLSLSEESGGHRDFAGFQNEVYVKSSYDTEVLFAEKKIEQNIRSRLTESNRTASVKFTTEWKKAQNPLEAAIYALSKEFNVSTRATQNAIWNYENLMGNECASAESNSDLTLWNAAKAYVKWAGYPDINKNSNSLYTGNNGVFETKSNKPNLMLDSSEANVNLVYEDATYMAGPFTLSYNEGSTYGKISFTKNLNLEVNKTNKDGTKGTISSYTITDSRGNVLNKLPNGEEFYIKFSHSGNENIAEINLNSSVQYISEILGKSRTHESTVHLWKYELDETSKTIDSWVIVNHDSNCTKVDENGISLAGRKEIIYVEEWKLASYLDLCNDWCEGFSKFYVELAEYYVRVKANAKLVNYESNTKTLQNMREVDGSVKWSTATASASLEVKAGIMTIAGDVWEDVRTGKDSQFNGKLDTDGTDTLLEGIEVRLYKQDGTLAQLQSLDETLEIGTNPTLTDANGHYEFKGVSAMEKYYVVFTYDGMIYTNTYGAGKPEYNTDAWNATSKGSELISERNTLNTRFVTIGSYPKGYKPTSILFTDMTYLIDGYNEIYSINDADVLSYKAKITAQLKKYLSTNSRLEDGQQNYVNSIYKPILNTITDNNEKVKARRILQYIWDCRINSYGGYESVQDGKAKKNDELYPYYNKIILENTKGEMITSNKEENINGYWIVYNGQLHINQGIIRRDSTDLQLTEDLYKTIVSINGKDTTYKYGSLSKKQVNISSADFMSYEQKISKTDYNYKKESATLGSTAEYSEVYAPIQLYVTYKINVTNTSMIPTSVREIATYFNTEYYSYSDTYTTTQGKTLVGLEGKFVANNEEKNLTDYDSDNFGMKTNTDSMYGEESETGTVFGADLYINFDKEIILHNNEGLALYVTYRLGENSTKDAKYNCTYNKDGRGNSAKVILQDALIDENSELKIGTKAEINAYGTYYMKNSDVATTQSKYVKYYTHTSPIRGYDTYRAAGVLDADSFSGNLSLEEVQNAHDNASKSIEERVQIEDDWDDATTLVIKQADARKLFGNVWEAVDKNEQELAETDYYTKYNSTYNIKDITVELIEIKDGKEYIRAKASTDENGQYLFDGYIPGEYVVRFTYGDKALYSNTTITTNGSDISRPYNGLFYQSTKSNPNTNANQFWYANEESDRYSDAYDEVNSRVRISNSTALQQYTYKDVINILSNPAGYQVYAYTSMLDIYPEKAKTETIVQDPGYTISNIDFGLTPRSLNNLEIKKEVTHLKLILQNGMVQFDADTATIREQGVPAVVQAAQGHDINVSMSSELVNGATLEITYTITVTNNTPKEQIIYYRDAENNNIAVALYNEEAEKLVYYEDAIRVHKDTMDTGLVPIASGLKQTIMPESKAMIIADFIPNNLNFIKNDYTGKSVNEIWDVYSGTKQDLEDNYYKHDLGADNPLGVVNMDATEVYNSNSVVLANANNPLTNTNLKPGESVSSEIVLSKVISVNNDSTDTKSYNNSARILKIYSSNSKIQDMVGAESEKVIISDPTGIGNKYIIIPIALAVFAIFGIGIILIKKFVMSKK